MVTNGITVFNCYYVIYGYLIVISQVMVINKSISSWLN